MHKRVLAAIALMVLSSGCQNTMVPVANTNDSPLRLSIAVGDTVRVLTKHGDRPTFKVTDISEEALFGRKQTIRYDDMAFVERRSTQRVTANAAAVILVVVAGAVAVDAVSQLPPGMSGAP